MQEILKDNTRDILDLIIQNKPIKIICDQIIKTLEAYFKEETLSIALLDQETKTFNHLSGSVLSKSIDEEING